MINLYDQAAIQKEMAIQTRAMMILERRYQIIMRNILNDQYAYAARLVEHGEIHVDNAVYRDQEKRIAEVRQQYLAAGSYFVNRTLGKMKAKKSPLDEALYNTARYAAINAAVNIQNVDNNTKTLIASLISGGISEGRTYQEVAKDIINTGRITNALRAQTIAQTEIHSVSMYSTQEAVRTTGQVQKKKWFDVGDSRTRISHRHVGDQPAIEMNQNYAVDIMKGSVKVGVEFLSYPGDARSSKGNKINCRCNQLFYTR